MIPSDKGFLSQNFEIEEILCDIDDEEKEEELLEEQQEIIEEVEEKAYKVFCEEFKSYIL